MSLLKAQTCFDSTILPHIKHRFNINWKNVQRKNVVNNVDNFCYKTFTLLSYIILNNSITWIPKFQVVCMIRRLLKLNYSSMGFSWFSLVREEIKLCVEYCYKDFKWHLFSLFCAKAIIASKIVFKEPPCNM